MASANWVTISTAGASGYTPPPDAPNITSASCSAYYGMWGDASAYGLQGTTPGITLPTGDPDYSHLKEIDISATFADGSKVSLAPIYSTSFSGSTITFQGPCNLLQAGTSQIVTLTFVVKNDAGIASSSPYTTTATVQASAVTGFTSAAETGTPHIDIENASTRLASLTVSYIPILNGGQVPQNVTAWFPLATDPTKYQGVGWWKMDSVGQVKTESRLVPASSTTWKIYAMAGAIPGKGSTLYTDADLVALGATPSSSFTASGIAAPANTVTNLAAGTIVPLSDPSTGALSWQTTFTWTDPTSSDWLSKIYVRVTNSAGTPMPDDEWITGYRLGRWIEWGELTIIPGAARTSIPFVGGYVMDDAYSSYHYLQVQLVIVNRLSTSSTDWSGTNNASSTAQGSPVSVNFGALPVASMRADRLAASTLGSLLTVRGGALSGINPQLTDGLANGGFEDQMKGWAVVGSPHPDATPWGVAPHSGAYACTFAPGATIAPSIKTVDKYQCAPGETYVLKATLRADSPTLPDAHLIFYLIWSDAVGGTTYNGVTVSPSPDFDPASYATWTDIPPITATVPANRSYLTVMVLTYRPAHSDNLLTAGYWGIDNLRVDKQITTGPGTGPDGNGGVQGVAIGAPNPAGMAIGITIVPGPTSPTGAETFGWDGTITRPTDLSVYEGCEVTVKYGTAAEGGAFARLSATETAFHNGYWPRPPAGVSTVFSAYPISRDLQRGTACSVTVTVGAHSTNTLDLGQANPLSLGRNLIIDPVTGLPGIGAPQLSDGIINGGFEDLLKEWVIYSGASGSITANTLPYGSPPPSGKYSCTFAGMAGSSPQLYTASPYQCKPGETYILKATLRCGSPGIDLAFVAEWANTATSSFDADVVFARASYAAWTDIPPITLTAPAGMSYFRLYIRPVSPYTLTTGYWDVDNIRVEQQVSTGPGTEADGAGGVQAAIADGLTFVSGKVAPNLGGGLRINPTTKLIEPDNLAVGAFGASIRPVSIFTTDPTLPDANYPVGSYGFNVTTKIFKRVNDAGTAWVLAVNGGKDIQAGTITATQIDATILNAAQVAAAYVATSYLTANYITASAIAASYATFTYLTANYATITTLAATYATIANLAAKTIAADHITAGTCAVSVSFTAPTITITSGSVTVNIGPSISTPAGTLAGVMVSGSSLYSLISSAGFFAMGPSGSSGVYSELVQSGILISNGGSAQTDIGYDHLQMTGLPSSSPGAGSKKFWYDASDGNRVKFAA